MNQFRVVLGSACNKIKWIFLWTKVQEANWINKCQEHVEVSSACWVKDVKIVVYEANRKRSKMVRVYRIWDGCVYAHQIFSFRVLSANDRERWVGSTLAVE